MDCAQWSAMMTRIQGYCLSIPGCLYCHWMVFVDRFKRCQYICTFNLSEIVWPWVWYPFVEVSPRGGVLPVGDTVQACCVWVCQAVQRVSLPAVVGSSWARGMTEQRGSKGTAVLHTGALGTGRGSIRAWCQA